MKHLVLLALFALPYFAAAQCNECTPDASCTSPTAFPAICPEVLPTGTSGVYYETVLTFYMPAAVVDPGSGIEATLEEIVVANVSGLPFGLTWQTNSPNNTYFPSQGDNLGCATLCGTPILGGEYEIVITVNVTATAFGFEQNLTETFSLPLTIEQGAGGNASFTYDNLVGCGEVTSTFEALITDSPGILSYDWDFGNGETSDQANPPVQTYSEPGDYTVSLTTTIENYQLNSVSFNSIDAGYCGDVEEPFCNCGTPIIGTCPDPYFTLTNGNGVVVYASPEGGDTENLSVNNMGIILDTPPYSLTLWDADLVSSADNIGSYDINLVSGSQSIQINGANGSLNVSIVVSNVFTNEEVVTVFPIPTAEITFDDLANLLSTDAEQGTLFVWSLNGEVVAEGEFATFAADQPGVYTVEVFNEFGCSAVSEPFVICPDPQLVYDPINQTLETEAGYATYAWTYNGLPIPNAVGNSIDASGLGNYSVTITTDYGCEVTSAVFQVTVGVGEQSAVQSVRVWPNPATDLVTIALPEGRWTLLVYDLGGRLVLQREGLIGGVNQRIAVTELGAGAYLGTLTNGEAQRRLRFTVVR